MVWFLMINNVNLTTETEFRETKKAWGGGGGGGYIVNETL